MLVDGDNEKPPKLKKEESLITYGINSKSTVTFSSIGEENAVISLQRGFTNFKGSEIEPQEIIVPIEGDMSDLLLNTAISLIIQ